MPTIERPYNGTIFKPADRPYLYMKYFDPLRRRVIKKRTPFMPGQEEKAHEWLRRLTGTIERGPTVQSYGELWVERRKKAGIETAKDDEQRLRDYVWPFKMDGWNRPLGSFGLDEVQPKDVFALLEHLKAEGYAPRTIRNTYGAMKVMWRDAKFEEVCTAQPCDLKRERLPRLRDATLGWRGGAVFSKWELQQLLIRAEIPLDRRVQYGILGLAALRDGEMCGLRWGRIVGASPLPRIVVATSYDKGTTKTEMERWMPVIPALQQLLKQWHAAWEEHFGRKPTPEDLVLPVVEPRNRGPRVEKGAMRDKNWVYKRWLRDLKALGLRHRRVHDLRRTFISLAKADGADEDLLKWGTHAPPKSIMGMYTSVEWETLCREVGKFTMSLTKPEKKRVQATPSGKAAKAIYEPLFT